MVAIKHKTRAGIVGAGPSGLLLSRLLDLQGIDNQVVERQTADYVLGRIRAGVVESGTVEVLKEAGVGQRLEREGIPHDGFSISNQEASLRIDLKALTGKRVTVYGQTEITRDLMDALTATGHAPTYEASDVAVHGIDGDSPRLTYSVNGIEHELECEFIAGCDGYHGPSRRAIPDKVSKQFERVYSFGWLGILSETPPLEELLYASHDIGFALCSQRSHHRSRYYVQCDQSDTVGEWSDERFWDRLRSTLPPKIADSLVTGPSIEKSIAPLRSYVAEPMQYGRLFLAGDAAHIVPPTGAKGLNLAVADAFYLSQAFAAWFHEQDSGAMLNYSDRCLSRVWKVERFSWWMTSLLHKFPEQDHFSRKIQRSELDYLFESQAMQTVVAENYVGLPL